MGDPVQKDPTPATPISADPEPSLQDSLNFIKRIRIQNNTLKEYDTRSLGGSAQNVYVLYDKDGGIITDNETEPDDYKTLAEFLKETNLTVNNLAPKDHSSIEGIYGLATDQKYGHVKLGYGLKIAEDGSTTLDREAIVSPNDPRLSDAREPISHAASDDSYGLGTSTYFGHIMISDDYDVENPDVEESGADASVAASAFALQQAYQTTQEELSHYSTAEELLGIMTQEIDLAVQNILGTAY